MMLPPRGRMRVRCGVCGRFVNELVAGGPWAALGRRQASAFFVGRLMYCRHTFTPSELLALLAQTLTEIVKENWG